MPVSRRARYASAPRASLQAVVRSGAHAHIPTRPTLLVDGTPFGGDSNGAAQRGSTAAWRDAVSQLQQRAAVSRQPQQAGEERTLHKGQPAQQKSADSLLALGFSALSFAFAKVQT